VRPRSAADVAHIHHGFQFQSNIVHVTDHRSVLLTIFMTGKTPTHAIVPEGRTTLP